MIHLHNVTKVYKVGNEDVYALNNVTLQIAKGAFVAIVGPSGSGKTTLANIIAGLDTPNAGSVKVDGWDITAMSDNELSLYRNKKIGFVFQSFNLQPTYTALENVTLPLVLAGVSPAKRRERAKQCLEIVGLGDRLNYKTTQLSGGQRQRVAIARALSNEPEIIIADEPTGNLDSKRGGEIIALLRFLNSKLGVTVLTITHDAEIAKQADDIIEIRDGLVSRMKGSV